MLNTIDRNISSAVSYSDEALVAGDQSTVPAGNEMNKVDIVLAFSCIFDSGVHPMEYFMQIM